MANTTPAFLAWENSLSPVDRWKMDRLASRLRVLLEGQPAGDWSLFLSTFAPMIGDDLSAEPETRLLLVRMAVATQNYNQLQILSRDTSPMVRRAAYRAADEMDGLLPRVSHHKAMVESIRWERARKDGRVNIPRDLTLSCLPPLQVDTRLTTE